MRRPRLRMAAGCRASRPRRMAACALFLAALLLSGCQGFDVSTLVDQPAPTQTPELTAGPDFLAPPSPEAANLRLRLTRPDGATVVLEDAASAQLVLDAARSPEGRPVDAPAWDCPNVVEVLQGEAVLETVTLIDDGSCYARNAHGEAFFFPEYAYGRLEAAAWQSLTTLLPGPLAWDPEQGTAALEARLPLYARSALACVLGAADGYFHTFRVVDAKVDKNRATVYLVGYYAAFDLDAETLTAVRQLMTAARVTLERRSDGAWQLAGYDLADRTGDSKAERNDKLRQILPYELMDPVNGQLSDDALQAAMEKEVRLQAMQFLQARGLGRVPIVD